MAGRRPDTAWLDTAIDTAPELGDQRGPVDAALAGLLAALLPARRASRLDGLAAIAAE